MEGCRGISKGKWEKELDYKLKRTVGLQGRTGMAVRFEYEWHNHEGQWFRSYGNRCGSLMKWPDA